MYYEINDACVGMNTLCTISLVQLYTYQLSSLNNLSVASSKTLCVSEGGASYLFELSAKVCIQAYTIVMHE